MHLLQQSHSLTQTHYANLHQYTHNGASAEKIMVNWSTRPAAEQVFGVIEVDKTNMCSECILRQWCPKQSIKAVKHDTVIKLLAAVSTQSNPLCLKPPKEWDDQFWDDVIAQLLINKLPKKDFDTILAFAIAGNRSRYLASSALGIGFTTSVDGRVCFYYVITHSPLCNYTLFVM